MIKSAKDINAPETDTNAILFNVLLYPYRSLGRVGFIWLMVLVGIVLLIVSVIFFSLGAWPIVGFAGLDMLALYWAFRVNYRQARAYEQIILTVDSIQVVKTNAKGTSTSVSFNPYWARLETIKLEDEGMTNLALTSHGKRVEIGAFLHAADRESLAKALQGAIKKTKMGTAQESGG